MADRISLYIIVLKENWQIQEVKFVRLLGKIWKLFIYCAFCGLVGLNYNYSAT